jgi:hypothetical protein
MAAATFYSIDIGPGTVTARLYEAEGHPFMTAFAGALAALGIDVVTFDFPYMEQKRRVPDRAPVLETCYRAVIEATRRDRPNTVDGLFIGGKSMGGRIATQIAAADPALPLAGLVLLGYPLHPPGNPARRRDAHLPDIHVPVLVVQGSRDTFGTPDELQAVLRRMTPAPTLHVVDGGDHSFRIAGAGKAGQAQVEARVQQVIADWIHARRKQSAV